MGGGVTVVTSAPTATRNTTMTALPNATTTTTTTTSRSKEHVLDCLFESIPAAVYVTDLTGYCLYANHPRINGNNSSSNNNNSNNGIGKSKNGFYYSGKKSPSPTKTHTTTTNNNKNNNNHGNKKDTMEDHEEEVMMGIPIKFPLKDRDGNTIGICNFSPAVGAPEAPTAVRQEQKEVEETPSPQSSPEYETETSENKEEDQHHTQSSQSHPPASKTDNHASTDLTESALALSSNSTSTSKNSSEGNIKNKKEKEVKQGKETPSPTSSFAASDDSCIIHEPILKPMPIPAHRPVPLHRSMSSNEARYRSIFRNMQCAAALHELVVDDENSDNPIPVDYVFQEVNPAFEAMTGFKEKDVVGRRVTELLPGIENDPANWIQRYGKVAMEGRVERFEQFSQPLKRWYACLAYRPSDDERQRHFVSIFLDVTDQKNSEEALRESEESHRNLFENMRQGAVYQDVQSGGKIIAANHSAERILGIPINQMIGRTSIDLRWRAIHEDGTSFQAETQPSMVCLKTGKPVTNVVMGVFHPSDESYHWIIIDALPRFKSNGELFQVYTTFTDVTKSKRFEQDLVRAKEKAIEADRLKSTFLANMSHEIRTPLNGLIGYTDLVLSNRLAHECREENLNSLQVARQSGELLIMIIQDILDLSKIEAGQMAIKNDDVYSLQDTVNQTTGLAQTLINLASKDIVLKKEIDPALADSIHGDRFRVIQVLNNLLSNAVRFTNQGRVELRIRKLDGRRMMEFRVRDTGMGIAPNNLENIFEAFRQGHYRDSRKPGGTGLGLTISRKLVELMGGELRVESIISGPHRGSSFYFTLPYREGPPLIETNNGQVPSWHFNINSVPKKSSMDAANEGNQKKKVLVAEDDTVNGIMIRKMLQKAGFEVTLAKDGVIAVSTFEKKRGEFDVILMDVQMPNLDGLGATKQIREIEERTNEKSIPIIALSADAMKGDDERGLAVGMTGYLTKPVNYKLLLETLTKYI